MYGTKRLRKTGCRPPAAGSTLVELLVVIAIIAILSSLALSACSVALQSARRTQCGGNVRQLTLALRMYADDTGGYPSRDLSREGSPTFWTSQLQPYLSATAQDSTSGGGQQTRISINATTVFRCPSLKYPAARTWELVGYGYNEMGYARQGLGSRVVSGPGEIRFGQVRESEVLVPSDMIALGDGILRVQQFLTYGPNLERSSYLVATESIPSLAQDDLTTRRRHLRRSNVGFCDGHVESGSLSRWFYDETESALQRWNRDHKAYPEALNRPW